MAGIGESAAETSPLSLELLFKVLTSATSGNPQQIKTSTKQLQAWEKTSGFYSCLQVRDFVTSVISSQLTSHDQDVFLSNTAPLELRLLSLIQLKNGIDIYWRRSATKSVTGILPVSNPVNSAQCSTNRRTREDSFQNHPVWPPRTE